MADRVPGFAHLHNHTTYSLLDGAQKIDEMCATAAKDGQSAIAITDHGNLFGIVAFGKQANKHGLKPIVGMEAYVAPGSRLHKSPQAVPGVGKKNYYHLTLLAENYTGYKNLIKLSSKGYLEGFYYRPRIDRELLEEHSEGLICLSGCLASEVSSYLKHDHIEEARSIIGGYRDLFGPDRYWLEVQDHGLEEQQGVNERTVKLAEEMGIGLVATNDCHYLRAEDHFSHDVLICIQTGKTVNSHDRMTYTGQHYLKSRAEMAKLFSWLPESVENSMAIADRCEFAFEKQPFHMPNFPVPEGFTLDDYFEKVARDGLEFRKQELRTEAEAGRLRHELHEYDERLRHEIRVIREMGFAGYFLITWDFIKYAIENGIPVGPGRGSAAGSLVAYCMRITNIDPLQYDLLFERFLNPERVSMPDIDIDFCFRKRERVIEYVTHKYGRENVSQIITFGTMAARAVIRDVGRGLEIPYAEVDRIAKLVPAQPGVDITLDQALNDVPQLLEAYEGDPNVRQLLDVGKRLEGLTRHASTHAAGVVIAPQPLMELVPLYRGTKDGDEVTTQWAKDEVEEMGLLKLDFLGLKTLTLIDDALHSIEAATGKKPDLEQLALDDEKVFELFCQARTSGLFQFESDGMRDILRRLKPDRFGDLIALNALYRPGPIGGGLIDDFIKRRHGKVQVEYPHPLLEDILRETYGVIVYQEQVMKIASVMAGYSLGEADILRRAMGKKKASVMEAEKKRFIEGAVAKGIEQKAAKGVFDLMAFFAGYGFNKSHSAAYALVAYHTAWLKAHHPVHFMAALLTNDKGNTDKLVRYINECRAMDIEVLPPDVNTSGLNFTVDGDKIRFGLSAIKGVGEGAIGAVLTAREEHGNFESIHDLCGAVDSAVNKRVVEALVQAGALDAFGARRSQLAAVVDTALEHGQKMRADREAGQGSLFGGGGEDEGPPPVQLPNLPEWDDKTRLSHEKATLGFYVSGHPLEDFSELLDRFASHNAAGLPSAPNASEVVLGGIITQLQRRKSKKGEMWASLQLEDLSGQIDVLVFPKAYQICQGELDADRAVTVTGRLNIEEDRVRVFADEVGPLEQLREKRVGAVQLKLDADDIDDGLLDQLRQTLDDHRGEVDLFFEVAKPGSFRLIARAEHAARVAPSKSLSAALEALVGPNRVHYRAKSTGRRPKRS